MCYRNGIVKVCINGPGQGHFMTLAKGDLHIKSKTLFSEKHLTNQSQILCVGREDPNVQTIP